MPAQNTKYRKRRTNEPNAPVRELKVRINQERGVKFQKNNYAICSCVILENTSAPKSIGTQLTIKGPAPFQLYPGQTLIVRGSAARQVLGEYAGQWYLAVKHMRDCADDSTILRRVIMDVHGIGKHRADAIVNSVNRYQEIEGGDSVLVSTGGAKKSNAMEVIVEHPDILLGAGVGRETASRIYAAVKNHVTENKTLDFLYRLDLTDRVIGIIRAHFDGVLSHKLLAERVFELTTVRGVGFTTAARIADKIGVPGDAPQRIRAAIFYALDSALSDGSVYATSVTLSEYLSELVKGVSAQKFSAAFRVLFDEGALLESSIKVSSPCEKSIIPEDVLAKYDEELK